MQNSEAMVKGKVAVKFMKLYWGQCRYYQISNIAIAEKIISPHGFEMSSQTSYPNPDFQLSPEYSTSSAG